MCWFAKAPTGMSSSSSSRARRRLSETVSFLPKLGPVTFRVRFHSSTEGCVKRPSPRLRRWHSSSPRTASSRHSSTEGPDDRTPDAPHIGCPTARALRRPSLPVDHLWFERDGDRAGADARRPARFVDSQPVTGASSAPSKPTLRRMVSRADGTRIPIFARQEAGTARDIEAIEQATTRQSRPDPKDHPRARIRTRYCDHSIARVQPRRRVGQRVGKGATCDGGRADRGGNDSRRSARSHRNRGSPADRPTR